MKLLKYGLVVASAVGLALTIWGQAEAGVADTQHNLQDVIPTLTQICEPCHAPHNTTGEHPLWNHALTTANFTRNGEAVVLGHSSKLCLSCHDGVTFVDAFGVHDGTFVMGDGATSPSSVIGTDLSDDHPIGVEYPTSGHGWHFPDETEVDPGTGEDVPTAGAAAVARMLEDGKVECGSCHYAHGGQDGKFLRVSITDSALCLVCHNR
jgi:predicted CXXCH cytochrome family protein